MTYVPLTEAERASMLEALGIRSVDALFDVIPASVRYPEIDLGPALTEMDVTARVEALAAANTPATGVPFFLGAGAYRHFIPSAVGAIMGRSEFSTSYTPYQPEVSQGTLQATFEFQSLICALTGMDVSNASVYDGSTALAEAVLMALRVTGRERVVLSGAVHPHYREVLAAYLKPRSVELTTTDVRLAGAHLAEDDILARVDDRTACCVVSQPTFFGEIRDLAPVVEACKRTGALLIEVYNPTSLGILKSPGAWGADIAVAEGQPLGIPLSFGGPYVGLMSCRRDLVRQMPGRIAGATTDAAGRRGFVLTLQAREQHIRREKATSNICTSETLMALGVTTYLALLGPAGLRDVATASAQWARVAARALSAIPGVDVVTPPPFFHELAVRTPAPAAEVNRRLLDRGIIGGFDVRRSYPGLENVLLLCCTELTREEDVRRLANAMEEIVTEKTAAGAANRGLR